MKIFPGQITSKDCIKCSTNFTFFSMAESENICFQKYVIYQIRCTICSRLYIGETKRCIKHRVKEHLSLRTSAVFKHHQDNHSDFNIFDIFCFSILHKNCIYDNKRLLLKAMYIKKYRNLLMNGCEGIHTHVNF